MNVPVAQGGARVSKAEVDAVAAAELEDTLDLLECDMAVSWTSKHV